jgi:hypothetical protein
VTRRNAESGAERVNTYPSRLIKKEHQDGKRSASKQQGKEEAKTI